MELAVKPHSDVVVNIQDGSGDNTFSAAVKQYFQDQETVTDIVTLLEIRARDGDAGASLELWEIYSQHDDLSEEMQDIISKRYQGSQLGLDNETASIFEQHAERASRRLQRDKELSQIYVASGQSADPWVKEWSTDLIDKLDTTQEVDPKNFQKLRQNIQPAAIKLFCKTKADEYLRSAAADGDLNARLILISQYEKEAASLANNKKFLGAISCLESAEKIYKSFDETQFHGSAEVVWLQNNDKRGETEHKVGMWLIEQSKNAKSKEREVLQGINYLRRSISAGYGNAVKVGQYLYQQTTDGPTLSLKNYYLIEAASDLDHPEAIMVMGNWNYKHKNSPFPGIEFSCGRAIALYKKASCAGLAIASFKLGRLYEKGEIKDERSGELATLYYKLAVQQSDENPEQQQLTKKKFEYAKERALSEGKGGGNNSV